MTKNWRIVIGRKWHTRSNTNKELHGGIHHRHRGGRPTFPLKTLAPTEMQCSGITLTTLIPTINTDISILCNRRR